MKTAQVFTDKLSIGLSMACAAHCLLLPVLLIAMPSLVALNIHDESFHIWMVIAVIPSSLYALTMGCKQHKRYQLLALGVLGIALLVSALTLGHDLLGETGEKLLTVAGSVCLAAGHLLNFSMCKKHNNSNCECPSDASQ